MTVISDTTPVISLIKISRLDLLEWLRKKPKKNPLTAG